MDPLDTQPWRRRLADWFDTLSDGQRVAALVSAMVFLGASCLYLVGIASILLVYRLGPPPTPPTLELEPQAAAAPPPTGAVSSTTPLPQVRTATAPAMTASPASPTPTSAPADTVAPTAAAEEPTPIAAPDVPRIRSVARMPEPAPVVGAEPEEDLEAVETRKPRVVATDAPLEETIIPLETPFGGTPEPVTGTPAPGGEVAPTSGAAEATNEARKRRETPGQDNDSALPEPTLDGTPLTVAAEGPTATPAPVGSPGADAEPTPKKVKRTPVPDDDGHDNDE